MFIIILFMGFYSLVFAQDFLSLQNIILADKNNAAKFLPLPLVRQSKNYSCGASALQSIMHYYGDEMREGQLTTLLKSNHEDGTSYGNIVHLIQKLNDADELAREKIFATHSPDEHEEHPIPANSSNVSIKDTWKKYSVILHEGRSSKLKAEKDIDNRTIPEDGMSSKELEFSLSQNIPVLVMFQVHGGPAKYTAEDDGHFALIIGFDERHYYFMDPSTTGNYAFMSKLDFVQSWHDSSNEIVEGKKRSIKTVHFGLKIYKDSPFFNFDLIHRIR